MAIIFDEQNKTFTIHTEHSTYQMQIDPYGVLLHLYYGRKTKGCMDYLLQKQDRGFSGNLYDAGNDRTYSLDVLPQEFPTWGTGDYRSTALIVRGQDGTTACDLRYRGYRILSGKYGLSGLPAVYGAEKEAQTLEVVLEDGRTGIQVTLLYGVLPKYDVITRSAQIINTKENIIYLEKAASACLDFVTGKYDVISFYGRHAMERNYQRIPVSHGNYVIGSRRGTSSHQYSPFLILTERGNNRRCRGMLCHVLCIQRRISGGSGKRPVRAEQNADGVAAGAVFVSSEYRRSLCHTGNRDDLQQKRAGRAFPESAPVFSEQSVQGPS